MKQNSDTSFISHPEPMQAGRAESGATDHLFLGHKLLGELKILMRLSSAAKNEPGHSPGGSGESSY